MKNKTNRYYIFFVIIIALLFSGYSMFQDTFLSKYLVNLMDGEKKIQYQAQEEICKNLDDPNSFEFLSLEFNGKETVDYMIELKSNVPELGKIIDDYKVYTLKYRSNNFLGQPAIKECNVLTSEGTFIQIM